MRLTYNNQTGGKTSVYLSPDVVLSSHFDSKAYTITIVEGEQSVVVFETPNREVVDRVFQQLVDAIVEGEDLDITKEVA